MRILARLPEQAPIRRDMADLGFQGENLDLAVEQAEAFYRDPKIASHVADQILSAYRGVPVQTDADGLIGPLIVRGLGHLPTHELKYYYTVEQAMVNALSVRDCGRAVRNRLPPQTYSDAMSRVAARLNTGALREYYRIELKAARLGVDRRPVTLDARSLERVETQVFERLTVLIAASSDPGRLMAAVQNLDRTNNAQACQIGRLFYTAILDLDKQNLRNGLIYLGQP